MRRKVVLTVAGFDNSGGGGLLADARTFLRLGLYPAGAITSLVVQDTCGVKSLLPLPPQEVFDQIETNLKDFKVEGIKVGVLGSKGAVEAVIKALSSFRGFLVVDPVLRSSSDAPLLPEDALPPFKELLKRATVITPNLPEAKALCGFEGKEEELLECLSRLTEGAVLLKGGHKEGKRATDYLLYGGKVYAFGSPKLPKDPRGTGCVLSSALLGYLVLGESLPSAVKKAKALVYEAIKRAEKLGRCREVLLLD